MSRFPHDDTIATDLVTILTVVVTVWIILLIVVPNEIVIVV